MNFELIPSIPIDFIYGYFLPGVIAWAVLCFFVKMILDVFIPVVMGGNNEQD